MGFHFFSRLAALLLMLLTLAACGGGDNNSSTTPAYDPLSLLNETYTVTATANSGGSVSPESQEVGDGEIAQIVITPSSGYYIDDVTGCDGTLSGNTYSTAPVTSNCTVNVTFAAGTAPSYIVSTTAVGSYGQFSPSSKTVTRLGTASFTVTPNTGYTIGSVSGCDGTLNGNTFTTGMIKSNCTVLAYFNPIVYTVTASAGSGGSISPQSRSVSYGTTTSFTVTPESGKAVLSVTGCGGSLTSNTYTTGTITGDCEIMASFATGHSIGGDVSGLSGTLVLQTNGYQQQITSNGPFTFASEIAEGLAYHVTVKTQPVGQKCTVTNDAGTLTSDVNDVAVSCVDTVAPLYPLNGTNWNDYVVSDGSTPFNANDNACSGSESGGYSACIHGGEHLVYKVSAAASCSGLTATDTLDAFDWQCDDSSGTVRFVSTGLKADKRLADLIDFSVPAWKENALTVTDGLTTVTTSPASQWWSNPLVIDNDGVSSSSAGTIYLVTADTAAGYYYLTSNKVGLVIKPGVTLRGGTSSNLVYASGKFMWIEGDLMLTGGNIYGINLRYSSFSVLRNVAVANARLSSNAYGIYAASAHNNKLSRVTATSHWVGVYLINANSNVLSEVTVTGNGYGLILQTSHNNVSYGITSANSLYYSLYPWYANNNFIAAGASVNLSMGLYSYMSNNTTYADIASAHNTYGVYLDRSSNNRFTGELKVGNNTYNCYTYLGTAPGLGFLTCANEGASDATLATGISLASAFVGKVTADESVNGSDLDGWASYPADPASFDWTRFNSSFRAWGKDGTFLNSATRGIWLSGNGRIYDWSLASADGVIKGVLGLPTGNDTLTHTWSDGSSTTFLRHAMELYGDGDGLCESNETCLYTPNIGAYQGHGLLVSAGAFTDGAISGVKLMQYQYNGR